MRRLWLVFLGVWILCAAGRSPVAGASKKKGKKDPAPASSVHEESKPAPAKEEIERELEQCVKDFKEDRFPQIKTEPERIYYWRMCQALEAASPVPCGNLKGLSVNLKKKNLTPEDCAHDAMFNRVLISVAQNSFDNCVNGLAKFPNTSEKSFETACREIMEAHRLQEPGSIWPSFYWAVGPQQCSKLSGAEYTEKYCLTDAAVLNAVKAGDAQGCPEEKVECFIDVGFMKKDKEICRKTELYMKRFYCLNDMQRRLDKDKTISAEHRSRVQGILEKNLRETFK